VLIFGLLIWGFWPQPVFIEAIEAKRAPLTITIEEEGRTRVVDRYIISAPVDGVACRQQLDVGDEVTQGQVLLGITPLESQVLDPRSRAQTKAQVAAAEAALHAAEQQAEAAEANAKLAVIEHERLKPLVEKGVISTDAYDKAATQVQTTAAAQRSADFQVEVAMYELQAATTVLEYTAASRGEPAERLPVVSPIDGRVLKVTRECEGPVRTGDLLIEVGDPTVLEVEVDVLSADAVKIKPGMKVLFERWGGEQPLEGIVRIIEPVGFLKISALGVEEQRVLIISDFTSPAEQWQRVGDGYRV
jgi:HlyD family secretion protein